MKPAVALLACVLLAACSGGGATTSTPSAGTSGVSGGSEAPSAAPSAAGSAAAGAADDTPITSKGPIGWNRGPYTLAGGDYKIEWQSDGSCTVLYFGIVGAVNGYKEAPSDGNVPTKQIKGGSRMIKDVPAGRYYFNVSGVACKTYSGTLSRP